MYEDKCKWNDDFLIKSELVRIFLFCVVRVMEDGYLLRRERARQRSWRWPTLKFSPFSATILSMPLSKLSIFLLRCTLAMASLILTSVCSSNGSRFSLTVPLNNTGSCTHPRSNFFCKLFQCFLQFCFHYSIG